MGDRLWRIGVVEVYSQPPKDSRLLKVRLTLFIESLQLHRISIKNYFLKFKSRHIYLTTRGGPEN